MIRTTRFLVWQTIGNALVLGALAILLLAYGPLLRDEFRYQLFSLRGVAYHLDEAEPAESAFAALLTRKPLRLSPPNGDFSLVIEKIGVAAPVVAAVPVDDRAAYFNALKTGIAHARGTAYPGEIGVSYLFAHSSINFWELGPYAQVFNLLRKLGEGDRIVVFYRSIRYDYEVIGKGVVPGFDTLPLRRPSLEPLLVLQTCDPPGTTLNRLIVTAKLLE